MKEILTCFFSLQVAQHFVAEHYEGEFDMIIDFKMAKNLVAEHHERDFDLIFHFMVA